MSHTQGNRSTIDAGKIGAGFQRAFGRALVTLGVTAPPERPAPGPVLNPGQQYAAPIGPEPMPRPNPNQYATPAGPGRPPATPPQPFRLEDTMPGLRRASAPAPPARSSSPPELIPYGQPGNRPDPNPRNRILTPPDQGFTPQLVQDLGAMFAARATAAAPPPKVRTIAPAIAPVGVLEPESAPAPVPDPEPAPENAGGGGGGGVGFFDQSGTASSTGVLVAGAALLVLALAGKREKPRRSSK